MKTLEHLFLVASVVHVVIIRTSALNFTFVEEVARIVLVGVAAALKKVKKS